MDLYDFDYNPNSITKNVNETFNVFNLNYTTDLPDNIKNNLSSYNNVVITSSNNIVNVIPNSNCIETIATGLTRINVTINYKEQKLSAYFDLKIIDKSIGENIEPEENTGDNKPEKMCLTYTTKIYIEDEYLIIYEVEINKNNKAYENYKVEIKKGDKDLIETNKCLQKYSILSFDFNPIIIEVIDLDKEEKADNLIILLDWKI